MSPSQSQLIAAFDREIRAFCGPGYKYSFDCYDQDVVKKVFEEFKDFAILPAGAVGLIKTKIDAELEKTPSMRLAPVFKLDYAALVEPDDYFDCTVSFLQACVSLLMIWIVLYKRDSRDDTKKHGLVGLIGLCILYRTLSTQVNSFTDIFLISYIITECITYIIRRKQPKQNNMLSIQLLVGLLPILILAGPYFGEQTVNQSLAFYAPFLDITFAFLQTNDDLRSPLGSFVVNQYFAVLMVHRSYRLLKYAYLYFMLGESVTLKLLLDIGSMYLYGKFLKFLRTAREKDRKDRKAGVDTDSFLAVNIGYYIRLLRNL